MITLRAAILTVLCFTVAVGTRCSCCKCDEVKTQVFYRFKELHIQHLDNAGVDTTLSASNIIDKDAYAMRIDFLCLISGSPTSSCTFPSFFISDARAYQPGCSCDNYETMPVQKIKSIKIEDLEKFDELPAGADVTGRFKFYTGFKSVGSEKDIYRLLIIFSLTIPMLLEVEFLSTVFLLQTE
ncbi:DUF5034 domain-containing protein [Niabella hibiscisoli]|uniref:DUF5034 domain-containing protein n=1 Tax=Niabella hibiscisoli TaxID=1825928 RepID=UPI001F107564|nr:DUF5034 domain-containing protein [Niabella hibiscisoli]MCH5720728.1 DUF5034 domain-containing protein [Niabella hibiscisoli]